jgi:VanZ family protein
MPLRNRSGTVLLRAAFLGALLMIFALALTPLGPVPDLVPSQDKLGHLATFFGLSLLGFAAWPGRTPSVALALLAYGALIEAGQAATGYRHAESLDWIADALGVATALAVRAFWLVRRHPHRFGANDHLG